MSAPIFIGVIAFFVVFIIFVLLTALLYSKGEVVRIWSKIVPYFPRMKNNRAMRVKIYRELIQVLTPEIKAILDKLIFSGEEKTLKKCSVCGEFVEPKEISIGGGTRYQCPKCKKFMKKPLIEKKVGQRVKNADVSEELYKYWIRTREGSSKFKIWCYRFKRSWNVRRLGVKGRTVYAYCLFSIEEMAKKFGRHTLLQGLFADEPLIVYSPSLEQYIQRQIREAELRGETLTSMQLKNLKKDFKYNKQKTYLATIFTPTTLSSSEENELKGRLSGFNNLFKINLQALRTFATELALFKSYKYAVEHIHEIKRELELRIHQLEDEAGEKTLAIQNLEHTVKKLTIPLIESPDNEPYPASPFPVPVIKSDGATGQIKHKLKETSLVDFLVLTMVLVGLGITVMGAVLSALSLSMLPILVIGCLFDVVFLPLYVWKKRSEEVPKVKPTKPFEKPKEVRESGE